MCDFCEPNNDWELKYNIIESKKLVEILSKSQ